MATAAALTIWWFRSSSLEQRTAFDVVERSLLDAEREEKRQKALQEGFAALATRRPDAAIEHFEALLETDPVDPEARLGLAVTLVDAGRALEARATLKGLEVSFDDARRRRLLAQLWAELGEWRRMISVLGSGLPSDPYDVAPALDLAALADSEGDWQRVLDLAEPLLELELPTSIRRELLERRARALRAAGRALKAPRVLAGGPADSDLGAGAPAPLRAATPPGDGSIADATSFLAVAALSSGEAERFLIRTDGSVRFSTGVLADPPRFVVDLHGLRHAAGRHIVPVDVGRVRRIRTSQFRAVPIPVVRVVFDLERPAVATLQGSGEGVGVEFALAARDPFDGGSPASFLGPGRLAAAEPSRREPAGATERSGEAAAEETNAEDSSVAAGQPAVAAGSPEAPALAWRLTEEMTSCLNLRSQPSLAAPRIACLDARARVRLLERAASWSLVRTPDGDEGWVSRRYLVPEPADGQWRVAPEAAPCLVVRDAPAEGARLHCLEPDAIVTMLSWGFEWSHVRLRSGSTGWLATEFLNPIRLAPGGENGAQSDVDDRSPPAGFR